MLTTFDDVMTFDICEQVMASAETLTGLYSFPPPLLPGSETLRGLDVWAPSTANVAYTPW
jgi:hypothetical protein